MQDINYNIYLLTPNIGRTYCRSDKESSSSLYQFHVLILIFIVSKDELFVMTWNSVLNYPMEGIVGG